MGLEFSLLDTAFQQGDFCGVDEWLSTLVISGPWEYLCLTCGSRHRRATSQLSRAPLRTKMVDTPLLKTPRGGKNPQVPTKADKTAQDLALPTFLPCCPSGHSTMALLLSLCPSLLSPATPAPPHCLLSLMCLCACPLLRDACSNPTSLRRPSLSLESFGIELFSCGSSDLSCALFCLLRVTKPRSSLQTWPLGDGPAFRT